METQTITANRITVQKWQAGQWGEWIRWVRTDNNWHAK